MKFLIYLLLVVAFLNVDVYAQTDLSEQPKVEEVYLAKDDGNGKAGDQVTEFSVNDIPIFCVVMLDRNAKVTVKMNFVAVKVAGVKQDTKVVSATYTTSERQNRVNFTGRPEDRWTPGTYRVDLFLDGKPATNLEFNIKGAPAAINAASSFQPTKPAKKPKRTK